MKSGRNIHGRLVVSFTVQRSFVMRIRVSGLHHTAYSLRDALLTPSLPCVSVSNGVYLAPITVQAQQSLSCAPKTCSKP